MKILMTVVAAGAIAALAAGPGSAAIPGDPHSGGLRIVYEIPVTAHSATARERYYRCRVAATGEKWCRYLPAFPQEPSPAATRTSATEVQGSILGVPLGEWTPL